MNKEMSTIKPNILFCIADDASHFGYNGHGYVKTPNIDRLAREGIIFENAFTTNPKCAPSRASILTGKHTWELEEGCNHCSYFPDDKQVYPDILEQEGYFVGYTGKGWAPGDYERCGRKRNPAGNKYNTKTLTPPNNSEINICNYSANFKDFLDSNKDNLPFCFWFGAFEPHRPYCYGESINFSTKYENIEYIPSYLPQHDIVRQDLLDYAYEINYFDSHVGNFINELDKRNMLENTLIIVTSDNGMPFPRVKGQMYEQDFHLPMVAYWKGKTIQSTHINDLISFIDIAPTFLDVAGITSHNMSGTSFLNLILQGSDEHIREHVYFGREKHDVGRENDLGYPVRCIRNKQWLYVRNYEPDRWPAGNPETLYTNCDNSPTKELILKQAKKNETHYCNICFGKRPAQELYNIADDEECLVNLITDRRYSSIAEELSNKLDEKLAETKDPRHLGNGSIFDGYPIADDFRGKPHCWASYKAGTFNPLGPLYKTNIEIKF